MTYYVFGGTLNLAQLEGHHLIFGHRSTPTVSWLHDSVKPCCIEWVTSC